MTRGRRKSTIDVLEICPNPYYSLDDEENEYAYNQEETERVSDVDTTDSEIEETSFGADPLDGVFGDVYLQDGEAGYEGGSPSETMLAMAFQAQLN